MTDEQIEALVIDFFGKDRFHFAPDVWCDFARALLAANSEGHPNLKVSKGVELFLAEREASAIKALEDVVAWHDHHEENGGSHAEDMLEQAVERARALIEQESK